jgi:hypothetical protein
VKIGNTYDEVRGAAKHDNGATMVVDIQDYPMMRLAESMLSPVGTCARSRDALKVFTDMCVSNRYTPRCARRFSCLLCVLPCLVCLRHYRPTIGALGACGGHQANLVRVVLTLTRSWTVLHESYGFMAKNCQLYAADLISYATKAPSRDYPLGGEHALRSLDPLIVCLIL